MLNNLNAPGSPSKNNNRKVMMRSESTAYAGVNPAADFWSRLQYIVRVNGRAVLYTSAFMTFVFIVSSEVFSPSGGGGL